jgi:hypothetical protein
MEIRKMEGHLTVSAEVSTVKHLSHVWLFQVTKKLKTIVAGIQQSFVWFLTSNRIQKFWCNSANLLKFPGILRYFDCDILENSAKFPPGYAVLVEKVGHFRKKPYFFKVGEVLVVQRKSWAFSRKSLSF